MSDDAVSGLLPVGFSFNFYGNTYSQFVISSNGFISFDPGVSQGCCSGNFIPSNDAVNNAISFDWDDLYPPGGGSISYKTTGIAPNRELIVSFIGLPLFANNTPDVTSQIVLFETSNIIEIHSTQIINDCSTQTMGIENATGTEALAVPGRNSSNWTAFNDYVAFIPASAAADNCGIASIEVSPNTFTCAETGTNAVTITVTDIHGNTATCNATVTIENNTIPEITCAADADRNTNLGSCDYTVVGNEFDATVTDICNTATIINNINNSASLAGAILPIGTNIVTWTATNGSSQVFCTTAITVLDNEAPTISCPSNITVNNDSGQCGANVDYEVTFSDNCPDATNLQEIFISVGDLINMPNSFGCASNEERYGGNGSDIGFSWSNTINEIPETVSVAFNYDIDCAQVQLETTLIGIPSGNFTPVVDCGNCLPDNIFTFSPDPSSYIANGTNTFLINVAFTGTFHGLAQASTLNNAYAKVTVGYAATQSIVQTAGIASGSEFPVGTTTNTFEVTDASGNMATCSFDVTVTDNEEPVVVCQDITLYLDENGLASSNPFLNGALVSQSDNCSTVGGVGVTGPNGYNCSNIGTFPITIIQDDPSGNEGRCTFNVTVLDIIPPNAI